MEEARGAGGEDIIKQLIAGMNCVKIRYNLEDLGELKAN